MRKYIVIAGLVLMFITLLYAAVDNLFYTGNTYRFGKIDVDTLDVGVFDTLGDYLPLSGGTMTGSIDMDTTGDITNADTIEATTLFADKSQTDTIYVPISTSVGDGISGFAAMFVDTVGTDSLIIMVGSTRRGIAIE